MILDMELVKKRRVKKRLAKMDSAGDGNGFSENKLTRPRLAELFGLIVCLICLATGCGPGDQTNGAAKPVSEKPTAGELVAAEPVAGNLVVEFVMPDDRLIRHTRPITANSTLEDVMRQLESPEVKITGSGLTAFVQSIGEVSTQSDRGWTFTIDGEFAQQGIGSTSVLPDQTVVWRFTTFDEAGEP